MALTLIILYLFNKIQIMKQLYFSLSLILIFLSASFKSQTATSIANGNWTNPLTWNCTCVPLMGHAVTINHTVTLNTSMSFTAGGITINNNGALMQDASNNRDLWFNGGTFVNNGKANFRYLLVTGGTNNTNNGTFTVSAMTNSVGFNNNGTITMDSMYIASQFTNTANGRIIGDSLTNASILYNYGRVFTTWCTNKSIFLNSNYHSGYALTNDGDYDNNDSLILSGSIWNKKIFTNIPGAHIRITKNFHNYTPGNTASFINMGNVVVLDSWYNTDTVRGTNTGTFTVSDTSANSGHMKGNFKFCDLTPPSSSPYIDLNAGVVSVNITWCTTSGVDELSPTKGTVKYFPNPSNGHFIIFGEKEETLFLYNDIGQQVRVIQLDKSNDYRVEISGLENGIYFLAGRTFREKVIVIK